MPAHAWISSICGERASPPFPARPEYLRSGRLRTEFTVRSLKKTDVSSKARISAVSKASEYFDVNETMPAIPLRAFSLYAGLYRRLFFIDYKLWRIIN